MKNYSSLLKAIYGLRKQGYSDNFNMNQKLIQHSKENLIVSHDVFVVNKYYREGESPGTKNQSFIYTISSEKYNLKGLLVNPYSIYSESMNNEMAEIETGLFI